MCTQLSADTIVIIGRYQLLAKQPMQPFYCPFSETTQVSRCRMVCVSASVNLPLHHKVQKFSSGTGSPGWSQKKGRKMDVCVCVCVMQKKVYKHWNLGW